jgi:phospholipid transport system substrate-binding protein
LLLLFVFGCHGKAAAAVEPPQQLIIQATDRLVHELRTQGDAIRANPRLAFELANEDVIPLIDFPLIAQHVLAVHWRRASPQQRQDFTREFRTFIINLYVTAMVTYAEEIVSTAESFSYPPNHWQPGEAATTVHMKFRLRGAAPIEVGYAMHLNTGAWKIHDVHVLGLSAVGIYRSNFASEVDRHGLDGLLQRLATKNRTGTYSIFVNGSEP